MLVTNSLIPAPLVNVQDPTTWLDEPVQYALHRSGETLTYYPQTTSNTSGTSTIFEVSVPATTTIVDRHLYLQLDVTLDFAGTAPPGQNLLQTGYDAFRAWPLQSCMSNLEITINGTPIAQDQNRMIPYLMRVEGFNQYNNFSLSTTPHYMDPAQTYDQLVGSIRNPLGGYGDTVDGTNTGRGSYPMEVVTNNNTTAQITATLVEPLFIAPLVWGDAERKGLCGVDRFTVKIAWANLPRMWSHSDASGSVFTTPPAVTLGATQLNLKYIRPQRIYQQPSTFLYGFDSYRIYPTSTFMSLASGASRKFTMNNVQLRVVPDKVFLFARKRDADLTYLDADVFAAIESINITWGVQNGILAGAQPTDLYQIARRNGVAMSWETWSGLPIPTMLGSTNGTITGAGSILPLQVGIDIPVVAEESPGVSVNTNVTIDITIRNPSPNPVNYDIFMITLDRGTCSILESRMATETGIVSGIGAVQAQTFAPTMLYAHDSLGMYGGGFFDSLWSGIKKTGEFIADKALPFVRDTVIPGVNLAKSLMGRGFSKEDSYAGLKQYVGNNEDDVASVRSYKSDETTGGKLITSSTLRR